MISALSERFGPRLSKLKDAYWRMFSIKEIENDVAVRLFGGAVLIGFLVSFKNWEGNWGTTIMAKLNGSALCWPTFQSCYNWIFMDARPEGYTQNTIFMLMLGVIFLAAYALLSKKYTLAHVSIFILFLWKLYVTSISYRYSANYDYYQTSFTIIFLFLPHKRFFGSLAVVTFYFLSTATKIHETWTLGTYFTSMKTGLPIFPKWATLFLTNLVIFMEMIAAWFLFSKNKFLQRTVFFFFAVFHLYSGTLVGYHYPTIVTPSLLIFFGPLFKPFDTVPNGIKSFPGWCFFLFLFSMQMLSHTIPGDEKLTLEGNFYGLYMFEANHQCSVRIADENDNAIFRYDSASARDRCDPYRYWFRIKHTYCEQNKGAKYSFKMTHSINGGPFYMIVNEPDLCALEYKPFSKNDWIKTEKEAQPMARPRQNYYR
ncbi:MAG TPA: hypothetical protein PLF01_01600 [Alphaproteobacteria bacterium]|nr:hypothetical protein [Alphaproteobacteria bacterium]